MCRTSVTKHMARSPKKFVQPQHVFACANSTSSAGAAFAAGGAAFVEARTSVCTRTATQNHLQLLGVGDIRIAFFGTQEKSDWNSDPSCSATGSIRCASPQQKLHLSDMLRPSCLSSSASLAQQFHPAISLGDGREQWKRLRYLRFDFGPREC